MHLATDHGRCSKTKAWKPALEPWFLFPFPKLCHEAAVIPPSGPSLEAKANSALFSSEVFFSLWDSILKSVKWEDSQSLQLMQITFVIS